jgi:hypothetical protein
MMHMKATEYYTKRHCTAASIFLLETRAFLQVLPLNLGERSSQFDYLYNYP